ncbi:unnamed protein product [Prunus armeniaca]
MGLPLHRVHFNRRNPLFAHLRRRMIIPVEVGIPTHRVDHYTPEQNAEQLTLNMDFLEEHRLCDALHLATYQQQTAWYYDQHDRIAGTLGANWEGPYRVLEIARPGTYRLADINGKKLPHPWNTEHLRKYYP